jgi:Domain of unknown function (DUF6378)
MRDPLLVEREKTHGDFKITADTSQQIKELLSRRCISRLPPVQREALDMIAVKIARILSGDPNCEDHWVDLANYARLGQEACRSPAAVLTDKQA